MLFFWLLLSCFFTAGYFGLIALYIKGWQNLKMWSSVEKASTYPNINTSVCVLIPARNEATRIEQCLQAVVHQCFPKHLLQVVVIDDFSTDETPDIVQRFCQKYPFVNLLRLANYLPKHTKTQAYKKKAIALAIAQTQQELIITTDADCVMDSHWLNTLVHFYEQKNAKLIAASVCFIPETNIFQTFQALDLAGMMVATGASIHYKLSNMCNGANLCYPKSVFEAVGGFQGIDHLASGDDMLLMQKIVDQHPNAVYFLKSQDATVYTYPEPTVWDFVQQRLRWASKSTHYKDWRISLFLLNVYLFNLSILINLFIGLFIDANYLVITLGQILAKSGIDYCFLYTACTFFGKKTWLRHFLPAQFLHILYIIGIGTWGNVGSYTWKGRTIH